MKKKFWLRNVLRICWKTIIRPGKDPLKVANVKNIINDKQNMFMFFVYIFFILCLHSIVDMLCLHFLFIFYVYILCLHFLFTQKRFSFTFLFILRYIVATQDRSLQEVIRQTPATPLLYLHVQAPTLEPPSEVDQQFAKDVQNRTMFSIEQEETLKKMKQAAGIAEEPPKKAKKKKKNKGGPNPLSCLKKKKKAPQQPQQPTKSKVEDGKVKKPATKKVRIPAHVREELTKQILRERGMSTNSWSIEYFSM